jgi:hypothetical protein
LIFLADNQEAELDVFDADSVELIILKTHGIESRQKGEDVWWNLLSEIG